ncbi:MAG: DUF2800 domain-containing protein [Candidatus Auribacter fodinae]|jgi:DNA helicase-2/ATP-dependent DNA helicase PcrA|uniref:DNA 3'-5' helicase n=1 Tax=Candidatus Auribacter fodinae TaxID=2093366 RepID=A0A3A4R2U6_9BACT|nr:MAG: DUF2800 domain-containing protein [Candidatus Auribacter fodinae]
MPALNPEQKLIVTAPANQPLLITAGAGTGKTRTLIERFVHLYTTHKLKPDSILLLTFTRKAAAEMKDRILSMCDLSLADREQLWVHTFHSFCARILTEEGLAGGQDSLEAIDTVEKQLLFEDVYTELMQLQGAFSSLVNELYIINHISGFETFMNFSSTFIDKLRDQLIEPAELKSWIDNGDTNSRSILLKRILYMLYVRFEEKLEELGARDYPKLIMDAVKLLSSNEAVRKKYRDKFVFVMVDEFQDTNSAQFTLLKCIAAEGITNTTVVGDPRQSIYQWRGADPSNMNWFLQTPGVKKVELIRNYRSYGEILDCAHYLLQSNPHYRGYRKLIPEQKQYKAIAPVIHLCGDYSVEPSFVASHCASLIMREGCKPDDIVILFRKIKNQSVRYETELSAYGLPYYTSGSGSFFQRSEVQDLFSYFRVIADSFDNEALIRILMQPPYNIGDADMYEMVRQAKKAHSCLLEMLNTESSSDFCKRLHSFITRMVRITDLKKLFFSIIQETYFAELHLTEPISSATYKDSAARFLAIIESFQKYHQGEGISRFVAYFKNAAFSSEDDEELERIQSQGCIRLMTLHKAKGLEFPVVFLVDLKNFYDGKSSVEAEFKQQVREPFLWDEQSRSFRFKNTEEYDAVKRNIVGERMEELWRLYYVGITRAQDQVYISGRGLDTIRAALALSSNGFMEHDSIPLVEYQPESDTCMPNIHSGVEIIKKQIETPVTYPQYNDRTLVLNCSTLHTFVECPYRYYLKNIVGVAECRDKKEDSIQHAVLGTIVHETIEEYHALEGILSIEEIALRKIDESGMPESVLPKVLVTDALDYYTQTNLASKNAQPFESEYKFTLIEKMHDKNVVINGVVDRLYHSDGQCRIVDFKTGMRGTVDDYRFQMTLYALACHRLFGAKNVVAELVFLHQKRIETFEISVNDIRAFYASVMDIADRILRKDFSPCKSDACWFCGFASCEYRIESQPLQVNKWHDEESYYSFYYDLVQAEQDYVIEQVSADTRVKIQFDSVRPAESGFIVKYNRDPYGLRLHAGDFIQLVSLVADPLTVQVNEVGLSCFILAINIIREWRDYTHCVLSANPLSFIRMKDHLFSFMVSQMPLKNIVLEHSLPELVPALPHHDGSSLDCYQQYAVECAKRCSDCLIIHGPPGTGKTLVIAHIVKNAIDSGKRVLVSAYTNRAVDGIILKLLDLYADKENIRNVSARLGKESLVHPDVRGCLIDEEMSDERIAMDLLHKNLVAVTSAGVRDQFFCEFFDIAVIDEAGQMPEPFALGIVNHTRSVILVGDDNQLPPVIVSDYARKNGLEVSLFERLKSFLEKRRPESVIMLQRQYRMNETIMRFASDEFYEGKLQAGSDAVAHRMLSNIDISRCGKKWVSEVIKHDKNIVMIELTDCLKDSCDIVECISEIVVHGFLKVGINPSQIGVLSPFREEVQALSRSLSIDELDIDTIDRFQGSDKDVVILSLGSDTSAHSMDRRRINVALTRAKSKLIIVGKRPDELSSSLYTGLCSYIQKNGCVIEWRKGIL